MKTLLRAAAVFAIVTLQVATCVAQPAEAVPTPAANLAAKVLVVYNKKYRDSRTVADYYMQARRIPEENRCAIDVEAPGPNNYIPGGMAGYRDAVKKPIQKCLTTVGKANILYIVFSYMTPFRVWEPGVLKLDVRAIDSLVADIWNPSDTEQSPNRYYRPDQSANAAYFAFEPLLQFRQENPEILEYSVWRLDAMDVATAKGLVDKARAAADSPSGRGCFDRRYPDPIAADTGLAAGEWDIQRSADLVASVGFPVMLDKNDAEIGTAPAPLRCENALFYGGWYSYGHYNDAFSWAPGAMGWHLDSLSLENPHDPKTWSAGAIARGITITSGVVAEPYLEFIPHLDSFFKAVLEGANVGDAMLRVTPSLNWMNVNVGDPLYAPFATGPRLPPKR
ncbi:MAG TPA: TIGR03790 family protein [Vicinamibacterales bacterium]|jgi:uncharacterized protein (TIGR03790 family)|nr:TIGR03790 family protein [Vicinamibacterales bacterium]